MIDILKIIIFLYACNGVFVIIGYFPTTKDLMKKKQSANISSYVVWTFTFIVTFLYALFIIKDLLFEIVTALNLICCAVILLLSLRLKYKILI